jgi:hypothetical protein
MYTFIAASVTRRAPCPHHLDGVTSEITRIGRRFGAVFATPSNSSVRVVAYWAVWRRPFTREIS